MKTLHIIINSNSNIKIGELFDFFWKDAGTPNGYLISLKDEDDSLVDMDIPAVWDAEVYTEGNYGVLSGGVGSNGYGQITVKIPKNDFSEYYNIDTEVLEDEDEYDLEAIYDFLDKHGLDYAWEESW